MQRLVCLGWRRAGAVVHELPVAGSVVWYAEFRPRDDDLAALRRAARASADPGEPRRFTPPTMILFHGLGASGASFHPVIPYLRRAYRVVVPDLPGYGSSRPPGGRAFLPFSELVDTAASFVARVAPRGAFLAGNSMGGWIATKIAARRPELVRGLALLNPGGPALRAEDWVDFARLLMAEERGTMREWRRRVFHRPPFTVRLLSRDLRRIMKGPPVAQLVQTLQPEDFLSADELAQVRCPAVLVWGERDRLIPDGCRSFYLKKLKGIRYEPVPDCGHCPQLECPERTADVLLQLPALARRADPTRGRAGRRPLPGVTLPRGGVPAAARAPRSTVPDAHRDGRPSPDDLGLR